MSQELVSPHEAVELRVSLARTGIHQYLVAQRVGLSEGQLSRLLTGRKPLTPELAARIQAAIDALATGATEDSVA